MATSLNPTARGLLVDATEFLNASELLLNRREGVSIPTFFPLSRAIELSLKAFLLHTGCTGDKLKVFGHNLTTLSAAANVHGLPDYAKLEELDLGALDLLSKESTSVPGWDTATLVAPTTSQESTLLKAPVADW